MRSSARISRTPAEYADHMQAERDRTRRELLAEIARARAAGAPWIVWLDARAERRHIHTMTDAEGRPVACPVPGCAAVSGSKGSAPRIAPTSAIAEQLDAPQLELIA